MTITTSITGQPALSHSTALVVGGGVAGRLSALVLALLGWRCRLYTGAARPDEALHCRRVVALFPTVVAGLKDILCQSGDGVSESWAGGQDWCKSGHRLRALTVMDGVDSTISCARHQFLAAEYGQPYWAQTFWVSDIEAALQEALARYSSVEEIGKDIVDLSVSNSGDAWVKVEGEKGQDCGDLLILASGASSPLRERVASFSRHWRYRADVLTALLHHDTAQADNNSHSVEWHLPGQCRTLVPVSDSCTSVLWLGKRCDLEEIAGMSCSDRRDLFIKETSAMWDSASLIGKATDVGIARLHGVWSTMVNGNGVILGDAAHAMAPIAAQGLNNTIIDAITLGQALRDGSYRGLNLSVVLRRYARHRQLGAWRQSLLVDQITRNVLHGGRASGWVRSQALKKLTAHHATRQLLVKSLLPVLDKRLEAS